MANERFRPRMDANEIATHSVPGATSALSRPVDSNAKLKTTSTRTANMIIDASDSLFRNSIATSLKMMAEIGFIVCIRSSRQPDAYVLIVSLADRTVSGSGVQNNLSPVHDH